MPRTVTANVETEIAASPNRSCWLVTLSWNDVVRMTNWPTPLVWNSVTYQPGDLTVKGPTISPGGQVTASLEIGNVDDAIGWYVLNYGLMDIEATIYLAYVDTDGAVIADPELLLSGRTNGGGLDAGHAVINLEENQAARLSVAPHRFMCAANGFNHLPPRGMRIQFADEVYELKNF